MKNCKIKAKFDSYPTNVKSKLLELRALILEIANNNTYIGEIEESLKWNELSYALIKTGVGTSIRIDWKHNYPDKYFIYFNCQTRLVPTFKSLYGNKIEFSGNRAIILDINIPIPKKEVVHCIELGLTYKINKHLMV